MKKSNIFKNFTNVPREKIKSASSTKTIKLENTECASQKFEIEQNVLSKKNDEKLKEDLFNESKSSDMKRKSNEQSNETEDSKLVKWEPRNWQVTLKHLREMRKLYPAPVDEMGCEKCSDETDEKLKRFHILVSLMLSSQTKDQVTHAAMQRLRNHSLTPANIAQTDDKVLENLLNPVCFYRVINFLNLKYYLLNNLTK